jgi:diguanylate cyclase (GGDEF)-like protein
MTSVQYGVEMPLNETQFNDAADALEAPAPRRKARLNRLIPRQSVTEPALLDWAHAVTAAAERRVATLEARIAHLESQVTTDEVTGLLNRRGFIDVFLRANAAARRGGPRGVVVLCDLDGFKKVNDLLGHAHGDHMLRKTGALLQHGTRKMDAVARIGGDEFALLLIGSTLAGAHQKCQGLAHALHETELSASFGSAEYDGNEDEDAVLHRADMAMYEEKRRHARTKRLAAGD